MCSDKIIIDQNTSKTNPKINVKVKELITNLLSLTSNIIKVLTTEESQKSPENILEGVKAFIDIIGCFTLETNIESQMWELLKKSLYSATTNIIFEANLTFQRKTLNWKIDDSLIKANSITVDLDFIKRPSDSHFSNFYCENLCKWLLSFIDENEVNKIQKSWPVFFTNAVANEWRANPKYRELLYQLETPFSEHLEFLNNLNNYTENVLNFPNQKVFDEPILLSQIYIDVFGTASHPQRRIREIINVRDTLYHWSKDGEKDMCFVSGDPGSGKSTVMKMLAYKLAQSGHRVAFVDLYKLNFSTKTDAIEVLKNYLSSISWLKNYDFEKDIPITIILDGLDEIKVDVWNNAPELVEQLHNSVLFRRHKVIISGRKKIIDFCTQRVEYFLKVTILPIALTAAEKVDLRHEEYKKTELLDNDLQSQYWNNLLLAFQQDYNLANILKREHLSELCTSPLMLFLLAWTIKYSDKSIEKIHHSVEVYENILYCIYSRKYNRDKVDRINQSYSDYKKMLSITGMCAWQNNSKCIKISEIEKYCNKANLSSLFNQWIDYHQINNPSKLLLLFFFREILNQYSPDDSEIEFIHKSFYEYLTAISILDVINGVQNKKDTEFYYDIFNVFSKFLIGVEIEEFIEGLLEFTEDYDLQRYAEALSSILPRIYNANWPFAFYPKAENKQIEISSYLELRNAVENIEKNFERLASILSRIKKRGFVSINPDVRLHLESSNFNNVNWMWANLSANDFSGSEFNDANLTESELYNSILNNCTFLKTNLNSCDLSNSELNDCDFTSTHMEACILENANLTNSHFDSVIFEGGYLSEATFNDSTLSGTILVAANLDRTTFNNCKFANVNFERAILDETTFNNVSFVDCVMSEAKLINVNISSFDLQDDNIIEMLSEADLSEANWDQVDIETKNKILNFTQYN